MSDTVKKPNQIKPESYNPKKPEILNMMKNAVKNEQNLNLPSECIITPKDKIAVFSGSRWPYSNVEPAVYSALGLFYGRIENRDDTGALINSDIEYSIHNVLTGHAFGLFYCLPDDSLSMAVYGLTSCHLMKEDYSEDEIITIIKNQIFRGNVVYIDEGSGPFDYFIWGYRDNGSVLLGYKFEHGNDNLNCSYDFKNPIEFDSLMKDITGITLFQPDGERLDREVVYKQAIVEGYRMLTQVEPPPEMDFSRVHFGYGQAIYDEWIRQLEQANAENSEAFYFSSPIFPHFIALYENRLHLYKFLEIYAEMCGDENLLKAAELCGQLKDMAQEGAQIGFENKWSDPKILAMTNNERRNLLIDLLKKCRALELEIAGLIKTFIDAPKSYSPKKPEILNMAKQAQRESSYPEAFLLPDKSTEIPPEIKHNCPGYVPFANEFSYFMDYSGQGYGFINGSDGWRCDVNYTLADIITGHAMRPACLIATRDELHHVYNAAGFFPQVYYADSEKDEYLNEAEMKEVIKYTLCTLGQPVILPVESRFFGSVVVGYKENGNVLVTFGYPPYFAAPDNTHPKIEEIANWYDVNTELTIAGKREKISSARELYHEGMRQVLAYLDAGVRGRDRHYYDEWESFLRLSMEQMIAEVKRTRIVPGGDCGEFEGETTDENVRKFIDHVADPTWCNMAERRYYIMHFFRQSAQYFPEEKEALKEIEDHFGWSNGIMGDTYVKEVGHDPVNAEAFENPEVRARMADCVRQFREADTKGLEMVEKLLIRLKI